MTLPLPLVVLENRQRFVGMCIRCVKPFPSRLLTRLMSSIHFQRMSSFLVDMVVPLNLGSLCSHANMSLQIDGLSLLVTSR